MQDKMSKAIEENKYSIGIFFDLAKAFDRDNHAILLKKNLIFTGSVASNSAGLPATCILQIGLSKSTVMVPSQNYVVFFSEFPKAQSLALFYFLFIIMTYQMLPLSCTSYFLLTTPMYSILILV